MDITKTVLWDDLECFSADEGIPWDALRKQTILITGATGLIGYVTTCALAYASLKRNLGLSVIAQGRSMGKLQNRFRDAVEAGLEIAFQEGLPEKQRNQGICAIIHAASPTSGRFFIEHPEETRKAILEGTRDTLEYALRHRAERFVFLSSMEVYGSPESEKEILENDTFVFDASNPRNSYPMAKLEAEKLCTEYSKAYGIHANAIRLSQTFGPGLSLDENRVFAQFIRSALKGKDIVLKTNGKSCRPYLYGTDAVKAILIVMLFGETGETYNAANTNSYCSIAELARMISKKVSSPPVPVKVLKDDELVGFYPKNGFLKLNTDKLARLGFEPTIQLPEMIIRTAEYMKQLSLS